ncbi:hypothetical protein [Dickeya zeae]|uniref:hypothetical protein n=1 Tax=Dickeya zeae TaxID=204042 RepID=UPI001F285F57|nr:hypothetical protein [Dickeya zeae]UJR53174.1 hypothetical protein J417_03355 [Dickeya zeae MS1]
MKKVGRQFILVASALMLCLITLTVYMQGTLNGNLDYHVLPAKMFGIPNELAKKGIEPLYFGEKETGWDGQFYYYMSNDLLGVKDTPRHIDVPSYRYQRIGLSLYTAVIAKITGNDWVSPVLYYTSYLFLVMIAVWAIGRITLINNGWLVSGFIWVAGVGTQVTLLNGLPDAAADSFLILGTLALLLSRQWLGAILIMMSVLSRESYVIFPITFLAIYLLRNLNGNPASEWRGIIYRKIKNAEFISICIPVFAFGVWQIYVRRHFGIAPSEQAHGILGLPFKEWWIALSSGLTGHHYLVPPGILSYFEAISLVCFMILILMTVFFAIKILLDYKNKSTWVSSLAFGAILMCLLYICFGRTVMMHYTGYMKAASLFLFLIPFFVSELNISIQSRVSIYVVLIAIVTVNFSYLWKDRIAVEAGAGYSKYTRGNEITQVGETSCLAHYDATVQFIGIENIKTSPILSLLKNDRTEIFWTKLTNNSGEPFLSFYGKGAVNMSYQWLTLDGNTVVRDGIRSMIPEGVKNGETVKVPVVIKFPEIAGNYILRLTAVQEGCSWFYRANPSSAKDIYFTLR